MLSQGQWTPNKEVVFSDRAGKGTKELELGKELSLEVVLEDCIKDSVVFIFNSSSFSMIPRDPSKRPEAST